MKKTAELASGLGCLVSVIAPLLALVLYPKAQWLFAFVLVGIAVLVLNSLLAKDTEPQDLADGIEQLLTGRYGGWDVDDFENLRIRDPQLKDFWRQSMEIGGPPEEWVRLDEGQKRQMREVILRLREFDSARDEQVREPPEIKDVERNT